MKRKAYIIAILAVGLAFTAALQTPGYPRIVSSARSFQRCFRTMQNTAGSLGPVERFVYSLILANSRSTGTEKSASHPLSRT